jgi:glucose/arabinose dehydrogenase
MRHGLITLLWTLVFLAGCQQKDKTLFIDEMVTVRVVADSLYQPWSVEWGPDSMLWVTENQYFVSRIDPESGVRFPLAVELPLQIDTLFALFMQGLALHPNFDQESFVYVSYMYIFPEDSLTGHMDIIRLRYDAAEQRLKEPEYFVKDIFIPGTMVMGGRLLAHGDYLFASTADEREDGVSQDISNIRGKILRFHLDGRIPSDNPFPGSPVYSYGHRNPQGLAMLKDQLYSSEHGPSHNDEVNIIFPGQNYGWPLVSGFGIDAEEKRRFKELKVKGPVKAWTPTVACGSLAAMSRNDDDFLLVTTLKEADLHILQLKGDKAKEVGLLLNEQFGRLRDVCIAPDGRLFITTYNRIQRNFKYQHITPPEQDEKYDVLLEVTIKP